MPTAGSREEHINLRLELRNAGELNIQTPLSLGQSRGNRVGSKGFGDSGLEGAGRDGGGQHVGHTHSPIG